MPRGRQAPKVHPGHQVNHVPKANQESQEHQEHPGLREHRGCPDFPAPLEQKATKETRETRAIPAHRRT